MFDWLRDILFPKGRKGMVANLVSKISNKKESKEDEESEDK